MNFWAVSIVLRFLNHLSHKKPFIGLLIRSIFTLAFYLKIHVHMTWCSIFQDYILHTLYGYDLSLRNGVLFVLAWIGCLRGWRASLGGVLAWLAWVACLRGWRASVGGVLKWVAWLAC